jgi:CheY-like chemotaxis protein
MSKILLVEDDQNLSEIYNARLSAEGYDVLDAANGEDALAIAAKEKPDLVISDVMMPRVSGFEMLDILRHTDGMQAVKIIMLTALGQDNDRSKASELGADRYLVKSQVTLEDIVNAAKELLGDAAPAGDDTAATPEPAVEASTPAPAPAATATPATPVVQPVVEAPEPEPAAASQPVGTTDPVATATPVAPSPAPTTDDPTAAAPVVAPSDEIAGTSGSAATFASATPTPTPDNTSASVPASDDTSGSQLAAAEPIAEEEAELQEQLATSPLTEDADTAAPTADSTADFSTPVANDPGSAAAPVAEQPATEAPGMADAPVEPTQSAPEVVPTPGFSANSASMDDANNSQSTTSSETEQPVSTSEQTEPPAPAQTAPSNHDEVLAAALKELEGESGPETTSGNPVAATPTTLAPDSPSDGSNAISGRKVIQPPEAPDKPDINQLLSNDAAENGSEQVPSDQAKPLDAPDSPGNISL